MTDHLQPRLRILLAEAIAVGPGKAELLRHIREKGSISAAARTMHMSYRRAWLLVDTMNHCFLAPLVSTATGGSHGGGAHLTEMGEEVLKRYEAMESKANATLAPDIAEFRKLMQLHTPEENAS
ncbi:MAG: winged helix-turn-helix domain-containing protein [Acidithiobacillus ferriphilus]|jgi:molybdate transport system regulatory protein|uniref:LysR family transcriptional regulator n=3 Tax=Acidithiobacillus TaxID=119977 RepID=A0A179BPQ9_ACIFR|nr:MULTISPECIES: winged helix-turn-helix domain-containing protein [Acidithiobacillus]OYV81952.1 MAG: LysR family transcriptional regulator [Acidithiobacillus ferrivorans]MBU2786470.1 LysR family transcriptional regulator [Acidithiobacillus ferriphilus]MBU2828364.1 LysR family transcriptional regulator [Acidithiobacillus ferriphilus]MBU2831340.1 LysR family transcriptional regulator [Acidithiobacillus ferriphilus]MBU2844738.1 LysR family transcriptional regulator [Acidithiobacillus ferriphilus